MAEITNAEIADLLGCEVKTVHKMAKIIPDWPILTRITPQRNSPNYYDREEMILYLDEKGGKKQLFDLMHKFQWIKEKNKTIQIATFSLIDIAKLLEINVGVFRSNYKKLPDWPKTDFHGAHGSQHFEQTKMLEWIERNGGKSEIQKMFRGIRSADRSPHAREEIDLGWGGSPRVSYKLMKSKPSPKKELLPLPINWLIQKLRNAA